MTATLERRTAKFGSAAAMVCLFIVGILNFIDRELPYILGESIKQELVLSDTALALVNGVGFLIIYAVVAIPLARMADRGMVSGVVAGCVLLWSAMTFAGAFARNGTELALTRMGVAVGEAGSTPAAHALIARHFSPARRGIPLALIAMAAPIGSMLSLVFGGLLITTVGWRNTFLVSGLVGIVLAPVLLIVLSNLKGGPSTGAAPLAPAPASAMRLFASCATLLRIRTYRLMLVGAAVLGIGTYSLITFGPALFMRVHDMSPARVGISLGLAKGIIASAGLLSLGFLVDRISRGDETRLPKLVAAVSLAAAPFCALSLLAPNPMLAIILFATSNSLAVMYAAPSFAVVQRVVPLHLRATASALLISVISLLGGLGPLLVGIISDAMSTTRGDMALLYGMAIVPAAQIGSAAFFYAASRTITADLLNE